MSGENEVVLWDDAAFRNRIEAACKLRGVPVKDVLIAAGASRYYLQKPVDSRSTNTVMRLARELRIPPEELAFGVVAEKSVPTLGMSVAELLDAAALRQVMARMFTAQQVMALMCLATNQRETNRDAIAGLILRATQSEAGSDHGAATAEEATPEKSAVSSVKVSNEA